MHIAVITKSVPDTEAVVSVDAGGKLLAGDKLVVNPWDEYAITEAILLKEAHKAKVTILAVGPEQHNEALKHGLAIGCDQAIRVWDGALEGHDSLVYAKAVAAAIQKLGDVTLVMFGRELPDIASDAHIFQTARKLGWNLLGSVSKIEALDFAAKTIRVRRLVEQGTEVLSSRLPAVISVLKGINEPKYPTFIGIRKASKTEIPVWGLSALGLDAAAAQGQAAVTGYRELPKREGAVEIIEGASAQDKAAKLVEKLFAEKVL
ncbi:MAG: electron transfer flavoprotein subunit beta/FixA family protein [Chloroflexi bacterium]|nr:electron transfer flavoprotein subunit beta/FixA family protein [Chloroflexota bacterium]